MNRKQNIMKKSIGEATLELHLKAEKIHFATEATFHPTRKWRFDFVLPNKIAVEVEGGVYTKGRHTTGAGFTKDCEKYNEAVILGWRVLRFTTQQVTKGIAIETIKRALAR